jgi:hypothetical protein
VLVADMHHLACAKATDVTFTKTSNATTAEAAHATSTEATHVTSTKAAHVASATTAHVASATTAATGLRTRGKKAAGKHRTCQNHHHSSSHYALHWDGRTFRHRTLSDVGVPQEDRRQCRDGLEMGFPICRLY